MTNFFFLSIQFIHQNIVFLHILFCFVCFFQKLKINFQFDSNKSIWFCSHLQGVVAFSSQGDRIALTQIEQMINGEYVILGHYDVQADNITWQNEAVWQNDKVRVFDILCDYLQFVFFLSN